MQGVNKNLCKLPIYQLTLSGCCQMEGDMGEGGVGGGGGGGHWDSICISDPKYWGGGTGAPPLPPVPTPMSYTPYLHQMKMEMCSHC